MGMSELVRAMTRLMLVALAGCAALMVCVWAAGRVLPAPQNVLVIAEQQPDGATLIYWADTQAARLFPYVRIPFPATTFTWSADGKLAFSPRYEHYAPAYIVRHNRRVLRGPEFEGLELAWSRDGRLAITSHADWEYTHIYVLEPDGRFRNLLNDDSFNMYPVWSADGRLAFDSINHDDDSTQAYILERDGSLHLATDLPVSSETALAWSPNGQLAFIAFRGETTELDVVEPDGTLRVVSNDMEYYENFTWSPDGRLAFVGEKDRQFPPAIHIWQPDGSLQQLPASITLDSNWLMWLNEGRLAFRCRCGSANPGIWVMERDGRLRSLVTDLPDDKFLPAALAPDGRWAYASEVRYTDAGRVIAAIQVLEPNGTMNHFSTTGAFADFTWLPWPTD
jgi:WD40 repeat protein